MMKKKVLKRLAVFSTAMTILLSGTTAFAAESTYTTVAGDNLSKIAKKVYDDASKWREIYESNKDIIKNPNVLYANQTLVIPDLGITTTVTVETPAEESAIVTTVETVTEETTTAVTTNASNMLPVRKVYHNYDYGPHMEYEEYEYDVNGNVVRASWYSEGGTLLDLSEHEYDVYNNETRCISTSVNYDSILETYEYDASGRLVKTNCFYFIFEDQRPHVFLENVDYTLEFGGWYEYEYDADGNMIKETYFESNGSISFWYEYKYDADGNMVKETRFRSDGSIIEWYEYEYEYDANGNIIKKTQYDIYGDISLYECEYDSYGNKVKEYSSGDFWSYIEYQY